VFPTSEILTRLNELIDEALRWGPALAVALVFVVALFEAVILARRYWAKAVWVFVVVLTGLGAAALLRWGEQVRHRQEDGQLAAETAALHGLWAQWEALSKTLPPPSGEPPAAAFDNPDDALASLSAKVASVKGQIAALRSVEAGRSIDPDTAAKLADYLRQHGSYRVVVSCAPGDIEAYTYANQLVGILHAAGWDANGPESTANVKGGAGMSVTVFVRDPSVPDAAKILLDAFAQFNIPHQVGISADYAIPDTATVEVFVAPKP
jgi:hypothetical protein